MGAILPDTALLLKSEQCKLRLRNCKDYVVVLQQKFVYNKDTRIGGYHYEIG